MTDNSEQIQIPPASNSRAKTRQRMLADEELSEYEFDARSHRIALEAHEDRLKLWEDVERLTRELADAVIIIDTQKVRIDGEDAERDKERQNRSKETSILVRAIEDHQRRNAELSMEIERLRAGLREIGNGHLAVSVWDRVNQILEGSPFETSGALAQMSPAAADVIAERLRQLAKEGWTTEHDDQHSDGQLAEAAACYALSGAGNLRSTFERWWPWSFAWWKPKGERRDLVRAGALILAEIERLDRASKKAGDEP